MGRSAVGGAGVNVASASAWPQSQESSTVLAASAMTGCVPHIMGKPAMVRTSEPRNDTQYKDVSQHDILSIFMTHVHFFKIESAESVLTKQHSDWTCLERSKKNAYAMLTFLQSECVWFLNFLSLICICLMKQGRCPSFICLHVRNCRYEFTLEKKSQLGWLAIFLRATAKRKANKTTAELGPQWMADDNTNLIKKKSLILFKKKNVYVIITSYGTRSLLPGPAWNSENNIIICKSISHKCFKNPMFVITRRFRNTFQRGGYFELSLFLPNQLGTEGL